LREVDEDGLGDFGGGIGRINLAQGGRVNEVGMAVDEFGKGGFDAVLGVGLKKLGIGLGLHFYD